MKNLFIFLGILILIIGPIWLIFFHKDNQVLSPVFEQSDEFEQTTKPDQLVEPQSSNTLQATIVAEGLDTPWAMVFLPDGSLLVTERPGRVRLISLKANQPPQTVVTLDQVKELGEGGLLGMTIHPDYETNRYVYLYYTYSEDSGNTLNRVVRFTYQDESLVNEQVIVDRIPGSSNHNGGRIKFGLDGYLYITTGDAEAPSQAQDVDSLAGKILRTTADGEAVDDNPFANLVYSYGHRNPQGLAWDSNRRLWSTEHGPSGGTYGTGNDELNLIESGKNYGWPDIKGNESRAEMETARLVSGSADTWAPSGIEFFQNYLFFGGLRGQALYQAVLGDNEIVLQEYFKTEFGRIRDVVLGPDNFLYFSTSNHDGRGNPSTTDDRIIRVNLQNI